MKIRQKKYVQLIKSIRKFLLFISLLPTLLLKYPAPLLSQNQPDDLIICVNNIAINGELTVRGLTANFPYPVLSTISVVDSQANLVAGLADTLRWLGPNETAENGMLVRDIWHPLKEYHRDDPALPENPDLYTYQPLITEIRKTEPIPTCTNLVMDVSTSMDQEIEEAKAGARLYIRLLRPIDSGGIVQFAGSVVDVQEMTRDTTVLVDKINQIQLANGTAVYDALMAAIDGMKGSKGRRSIIIYTDGADNRSTVTPQAVIDSAQAYNLPIYTIALGNSAQEEVLMEIAHQTSAIFFRAATAEQMKIILGKLSVLMQNYYVMAHGSTDPNSDRTWRLVDVGVNTGEPKGRGVGRYFVGDRPGNPVTDLSIKLSSITDSSTIIAGDTLNAVTAGSEFEYKIRLENYGPTTAGSVQVVQLLPDSVKFLAATPAPDFNRADSIGWNFSNFMPLETRDFLVRVRLADKLPPGLVDLISTARLYATDDTLPENNLAADTVRILFPAPRKNYNLALEQLAITDTTVEIAGQSEPAVILGELFRYLLKIKNYGPATAKNIVVWDALPDSVLPTGFSLSPARQTPDSLFWRLDSLPAGNSIEIDFVCVTKELAPFTPFPFVNPSGIVAANDTLVDDNVVSTLVYGIDRLENPSTHVDISVRQFAQSDSFEISGNDTLKFVTPGDNYLYFLRVKNETDVPARNIRITDILPNYISASDFQPAPGQITRDSLVWAIGELQPQTSYPIQFKATVPAQMPPARSYLINLVKGRAENEKPEYLANNSAIDTVINVNLPPIGWEPLIQALPERVSVGDKIQIKVQATAEIPNWDLWVRRATGLIDSTYGDAFIPANPLVPNLWREVLPEFQVTEMVTDAEEEPLVFELRGFDAWGTTKTAQASVTIQRTEDFNIDRNVFVPDQEGDLEIQFKLESNQAARLEIYDITGTRITKLTEAHFQAGWNTYRWNGLTEYGQKIGSGFYIITIQSGGYHAWKKLLIVR